MFFITIYMHRIFLLSGVSYQTGSRSSSRILIFIRVSHGLTRSRKTRSQYEVALKSCLSVFVIFQSNQRAALTRIFYLRTSAHFEHTVFITKLIRVDFTYLIDNVIRTYNGNQTCSNFDIYCTHSSKTKNKHVQNSFKRDYFIEKLASS